MLVFVLLSELAKELQNLKFSVVSQVSSLLLECELKYSVCFCTLFNTVVVDVDSRVREDGHRLPLALAAFH